MSQRALRNLLSTPSWQRLLADAVRQPAELLRLLDLPRDLLPAAEAAARLFPLRVPRGYVARMEQGNPADPLLRQVLPLHEETQPAMGYAQDAVGDGAAMAAPGLLHKYRGRSLLVTTGACAIHCRYCFRRHFPYGDANPLRGHWPQVLEYLQRDTTIDEVILSGGDPLSLGDDKLASLAADIAAIRHVKRLRVHSRLPVVLPERVTGGLLQWMTATRLQPVMVIHSNHPNELDAATAEALGRMRRADITVLNQSVLLRGVNDDADTLCRLSERLFQCGVLPYYLHVLDKVEGAAHFDLPDAAAAALHGEMAMSLPGYLVPRLVRESAGAPYKLPVRSLLRNS